MSMSKSPTIYQNRGVKLFRSENYNYNFDLRSGNFQRWGKWPEDDPAWSPFGPEILDIEISEGEGCPMTCAFCYKGNRQGNKAVNMSLDEFKKIFDKLPHIVSRNGERLFFTTQIAFGITSVNSHPQLFDIFDYCRANSVIPNVTINGADKLTDLQVQRLVDTCGAMAISINKTNAEAGLTLLKRMTDRGGSQINIHYVISQQSMEFLYELLQAIKTDHRLKGLNAIVFLGLKPKERGQLFDILPTEEYIKLVKFCLDWGINFGFDSCSAPKFDKALESLDMPKETKKALLAVSERCESGLFSAYIDCSGKYWHCSFGENNEKGAGIDLNSVTDFHKEVWLSLPVKKWRGQLFKLKRECPLYPAIHSDK